MKPYKEVILFDNLAKDLGTIKVTQDTNYQLKRNSVQVLWGGSIEKFISDFELPSDSVIDTKSADFDGNNTGANMIFTWNLTTISFKFNYQVWYKDAVGENFYVLGSNNTIDLTVPNFICFSGDKTNDSPFFYAGSGTNRIYNPNLFPLPISISSFSTSNKIDDFQQINGSGINSLCYLVFRFGVSDGNAVGGTDRDDIQICLLTRDNGNFQINTRTLVIPYASLTFTGFNKIKRL